MSALTPTNGSGISTASRMRRSSYFSKEFVLDRYSEVIFEIPSLSNATGPADLLSQGTGTVAITEINSSEICALVFNSDTDSHGYLWVLPVTLDESQAIDFSISWNNSQGAATGSCLFSVVYTAISAGVTALSVGATALDTIIANQVDLAANVQTWSPWGSIAAGTSAITALIPGDDMLALKMAVDVTTITNANATSMRARYYRKFV